MKKNVLLIAFLITLMIGGSELVIKVHFGMAQNSDTSQATILSYSYYVAPSNTILASEAGDLIIVGEIENVGSNIIGNVTIQGIAFGSNGQELAITTTQAFAYYMLPGQEAPFYIDLNAASSSTNNLSWVSSVSSVTVLVSSVTNFDMAQYSGLTIEDESPYVPGNGIYYVVGTIVNNGNQTAQDPWVVTTFYNAAGKVIGLNFTDYLTGSLAPDGTIQFFASPTDDTSTLTSEIANYTSTVDSLTLTTSSSTSATATPTSVPSLTASPTTVSSPTPTASLSSQFTVPEFPSLLVILTVFIAVSLSTVIKVTNRKRNNVLE